MKSVIEKSKSIKNEADKLLLKYDLIDLLSNYGRVEFTGSYKLDLMLKKDIDISLVSNTLSLEQFTELGKSLVDKIYPSSVYFRNTRKKPINNRPENALYWGIEIDEWFLDIWALSEDVFLRSKKYLDNITSKLNSENRIIILTLKSLLIEKKTYGKNFSSKELYDAVLKFNVKSEQEFEKYLSTHSKQLKYI